MAAAIASALPAHAAAPADATPPGQGKSAAGASGKAASSGKGAPSVPSGSLSIDTSREPERVIFVAYRRPGWWDMIGVTYDHKPLDRKIRQDLGELAKQTGWSITDPTVTHDRPSVNGPVMTSVEFAAPAIDLRTGRLPIEAILLAYREYKTIGAVFFTGEDFRYRGPLRYSTPDAAMTGEAGRGSYAFHMVVRNAALKSFDLPYPETTEEVKRNRPARSSDLTLRLALVIGLAVAVAAIAYGIASLRSRGTD